MSSFSFIERRLDKAVHLTSRSRAVLQSWRYLGSFLQFSQEELNEIDNTECKVSQKCERMLRLWRIREEPHQGPQKLTDVLRRAGFFYIAGRYSKYASSNTNIVHHLDPLQSLSNLSIDNIYSLTCVMP